MRIGIIGLAFLALSCGAKAQVCTPGAQVACACAGGGSGAQVCTADGTALGVCTGCVTLTSDSGVAAPDAGTVDAGTVSADAGTSDIIDGGVTVTIQQITTETVAPNTEVTVRGAIAMSQKFLVASSKTTGTCLWGVYVSAPGLATTEQNSGLLVISYGFSATIPPGGSTAFCPSLGLDPTGSVFDDAIAPGDVVDFAGQTSKTVVTLCTNVTAQHTVSAKQAVSRGKAAVPTPAIISGSDIALLADGSNVSFHQGWGGVKIEVRNQTSTVEPDGGVVDAFGRFSIAGGTVEVSDKIFYRAPLKATQPCHAQVQIASPSTLFTSIKGFNAIDSCTWELQPNDKCADLSPPSTDCVSATACVP